MHMTADSVFHQSNERLRSLKCEDRPVPSQDSIFKCESNIILVPGHFVTSFPDILVSANP